MVLYFLLRIFCPIAHAQKQFFKGIKGNHFTVFQKKKE